MTPDMPAFVETAQLLADKASETARSVWMGESETTFKLDQSAITEADTAIEEQLRCIVASRHPDHGVLGEEFGDTGLERDFVWVIDPIDGTRQFGARLMNFGVLIALCYRQRPVLGLMDQPLAGARFLGVEGQATTFNGRPVTSRPSVPLSEATLSLANPNSFCAKTLPGYERLKRHGRMTVFDGGCISYGSLSRGMVDICLNGPDLEPFDICALVPIIEGAGGVISTWAGDRLSLSSVGPIVATAHRSLHDEVCHLLA